MVVRDSRGEHVSGAHTASVARIGRIPVNLAQRVQPGERIRPLSQEFVQRFPEFPLVVFALGNPADRVDRRPILFLTVKDDVEAHAEIEVLLS